MAAAATIKMDELLVSWLGSDSMYDNIMNLIEENKLQQKEKEKQQQLEQQQQQLEQQQQQQQQQNEETTMKDNVDERNGNGGGGENSDTTTTTTTATNENNEATSTTKKDDTTMDNTNSNNDDNDDGTATTTTSNSHVTQSNNSSSSSKIITIPKFYIVDSSRPRRRRRLLPMPQNHTWEPLPRDEQQEKEEETRGGGETTTTTNNNNNNDMNRAAMVLSSGDELSSSTDFMMTTTNNNNNNNTNAVLCVRDQVRAVFQEIGQDITTATTDAADGTAAATGSDVTMNNDDTTTAIDHKAMTVQAFVRITKDIFQFPTFFNIPLCQRLLFLWKKRNQNSKNKNNRNDNAEDEHDDNNTKKDNHINTNTNNTTTETSTTISMTTSDDDDIDIHEEPTPDTLITYEMVQWYWLQEMEPYDTHERLFRLCKKPHNTYIVRDDFLPFIKALLNDHPGLEFLSNHAEFQEKYAITVITRIFYSVDKSHSGRITCRQIRRSDLLDAFLQVDDEEDINKVTRYFSYEHFYVLYCRFWELDHDRDYRITREDLLKYGDHSLSHMIVDRIFDAAPRPFEQPSALDNVPDGDGTQNNNAVTSPAINREYLSYEDFIYFMLSEEDKANDVSVRYWFTCVDVDGDGRLNNMEMRSFYAVQLHRMQCMGHEIVPFEDMLCQMMDMIKPACTDYLVVEDFLQPECAPVAGALFDALFNLNKYLLFEQRDPFVERQKREDEFESDWDRFACIDYNRLAMEEEAREEEAMEIDWVTVDDEEDDGLVGSNAAAGGAHGMQMQIQQADDYMGSVGGYSVASSEAPF